MIWSRFNYLFESKKHGFFVYNSRTNAFLKVEKDLFYKLTNISSNIKLLSMLSKEILKDLEKSKIIVGENEDENFILQMKVLKYATAFSRGSLGIVIATTTACNFACPYCYEKDLPPIMLDNEVENGIMNFINSFNIPNLEIAWYGGEPLLNLPSILKLLEKIDNEKKLNLTEHTIVTNGYLLNKEVCNKLNNTKLGSIQVTIDGLPETHNKLRCHKSGKDTFNTIISNIDNVVKLLPNCEVHIRVNIGHENHKDFPMLYEFFKKKWPNNKKISVIPCYIVDHGGCKTACFKNSDKVNFYKELYKTHNIKNINFLPSFDIGGCTVDNFYGYVIDAEGYIYKCWVDIGKKERILGSVKDLSSFNHSLQAEYVLGTNKYSDRKCLNCIIFPVCDGGCGVFRLNQKLNGQKYNCCPIDIKNLKDYLEIHYEKTIENL